MRTWPAAVVVLGSIFFPVAVVHTQSDAHRETLRGIGPVRVAIERMNPDAERDGLTEQSLKTTVELRLRQNGIPLGDVASPFLYVRVSTRERGDLYAYSIDAELRQLVTVPNGRMVIAPTWFIAGLIGSVGSNNLQNLRDSVLDGVDEFSNDYLAMNPSP